MSDLVTETASRIRSGAQGEPTTTFTDKWWEEEAEGHRDGDEEKEQHPLAAAGELADPCEHARAAAARPAERHLGELPRGERRGRRRRGRWRRMAAA